LQSPCDEESLPVPDRLSPAIMIDVIRAVPVEDIQDVLQPLRKVFRVSR
jgi:hypothetical protein